MHLQWLRSRCPSIVLLSVLPQTLRIALRRVLLEVVPEPGQHRKAQGAARVARGNIGALGYLGIWLQAHHKWVQAFVAQCLCPLPHFCSFVCALWCTCNRGQHQKMYTQFQSHKMHTSSVDIRTHALHVWTRKGLCTHQEHGHWKIHDVQLTGNGSSRILLLHRFSINSKFQSSLKYISFLNLKQFCVLDPPGFVLLMLRIF